MTTNENEIQMSEKKNITIKNVARCGKRKAKRLTKKIKKSGKKVTKGVGKFFYYSILIGFTFVKVTVIKTKNAVKKIVPIIIFSILITPQLPKITYDYLSGLREDSN